MCKKYSKKKNRILTDSKDLALKFPLQPRPIKMTVSQCRKGPGFLNGSSRRVRNHEILLIQVNVVSVVVKSFPRQKENKLKLAKHCGRKASKI